MNRLNLLPISFLLILFTSSACGRFPLPAPATQPNPDNSFIETVVAQTLTAFPSPTPQPTPTLTLTQTSAMPPQTPREFIFWYFDNINSRNYTLTWSFLTEGYKDSLGGSARYGYLDYVTFWNTVKLASVKDVFSTRQGDLCAVSVTLQLDYYDGKSETDAIPYTLQYDHARATWLFDYIPVPTATRAWTPTVTRTPTRDSHTDGYQNADHHENTNQDSHLHADQDPHSHPNAQAYEDQDPYTHPDKYAHSQAIQNSHQIADPNNRFCPL